MSEEQQSPALLLQKLDKLLQASPISEQASGTTDDPEYTAQHEEWYKHTDQERNIVQWIVNRATATIKSSRSTDAHGAGGSPPFRILSVGCGDGRNDLDMLSQLIKQLPQVAFEYVGLDINQLSCENASKILQSLKAKTKIICVDMENVTEDLEGLFDLVIMTHCLYYLTSLKPVLSHFVKLLKPKGELIIVSAIEDERNQLVSRFWKHEHKRPFWLSRYTLDALNSLQLKYKLYESETVLDLTSCFVNNFEKPHDLILGFLTQTRFWRYPTVVKETCIQYLEAIAVGKPKEYLIPHKAVTIVVQPVAENP